MSRWADVSLMSSVDMSSENLPAEWMGDTDKCTICSDKLGKRVLNPRHHCRLCGRCVCHKCSPATVEVEGCEGPQRVCKVCVVKAFREAKLSAEAKERLEAVVGRIWEVADSDGYSLQGDVNEVVTVCASAADSVERSMVKVRRELATAESRATATEASLVEARLEGLEAARELGTCRGVLSDTQTLHALERKGKEVLQEAMASCEVALYDSEALCEMKQRQSLELQSALGSTEAKLKDSKAQIEQEMIVRGELLDSLLTSEAFLEERETQLADERCSNAELHDAFQKHETECLQFESVIAQEQQSYAELEISAQTQESVLRECRVRAAKDEETLGELQHSLALSESALREAKLLAEQEVQAKQELTKSHAELSFTLQVQENALREVEIEVAKDRETLGELQQALDGSESATREANLLAEQEMRVREDLTRSHVKLGSTLQTQENAFYELEVRAAEDRETLGELQHLLSARESALKDAKSLTEQEMQAREELTKALAMTESAFHDAESATTSEREAKEELHSTLTSRLNMLHESEAKVAQNSKGDLKHALRAHAAHEECQVTIESLIDFRRRLDSLGGFVAPSGPLPGTVDEAMDLMREALQAAEGRCVRGVAELSQAKSRADSAEARALVAEATAARRKAAACNPALGSDAFASDAFASIAADGTLLTPRGQDSAQPVPNSLGSSTPRPSRAARVGKCIAGWRRQ